MQPWMKRFQFFLKIIGKMQANLLILKVNNEIVELVQMEEGEGEKSYIVERSDGAMLTVGENELGSRPLIADRRVAIGLSAALTAVLALLSVFLPDYLFEDLVQEARNWFDQATKVN